MLWGFIAELTPPSFHCESCLWGWRGWLMLRQGWSAIWSPIQLLPCGALLATYGQRLQRQAWLR